MSCTETSEPHSIKAFDESSDEQEKTFPLDCSKHTHKPSKKAIFMLSTDTLVKYSARTSLNKLKTTPSNISCVREGARVSQWPEKWRRKRKQTKRRNIQKFEANAAY